jgi:hypothetical protein
MPEGTVRPWLELLWLGYSRLPEAVLEIKEKGGVDVGFGELPRVIAAGSEEEEKDYHI